MTLCVSSVLIPVQEYEGHPPTEYEVVVKYSYPRGECPFSEYLDAYETQQLVDGSNGGGTGTPTDSNALPSSADAAAAWGVGFSLVVSSYVIGCAVGAVVNFINRK